MANLVLLIVGAVVGTACDQMHVRAGVLGYPRPFLFDQAWWVPPLFAVSALAVAHGPALATRALLPDGTRGTDAGRDVATAGAWFAAAYASTAVFAEHPAAVLASLTIAWTARVAWSRPSPREAAVVAGLSLATALVGPIVEATLSSLGLFRYRRPDVLGFPIWLPALYLHAALLGRAIGRRWFGGR